MTVDTYGVNPHAPESTGRPRPPPPTAGGDNTASGTGVFYDGQAGKLFGLGLKIAFLSLITLGFYRFWGKTQVRRYLASRLSLMGDRFEYTGTGKELFLGFLVALGVLIPLGAASYGIDLFLAGKPIEFRFGASILQYGFILFLIGYATFRARRYRLSRTALRGIRFWQTGSAAGYGLRMMGYLALTLVTLGIARPVGDVALHRYFMKNTWFGSQHFHFDGRAAPMMGRWVLSLLLGPVTLGLSLLWYAAFRMRYLASQTRFLGIHFSLPITFGNLLRIYAPYVLVITLLSAAVFAAVSAVVIPSVVDFQATNARVLMQANMQAFYLSGVATAFLVFGVIAPVLKLVMLTHRFVRLAADRLQLTGAADPRAIVQSAALGPKSGEGLADAFDVGGGLEVGL